MLEKHRAHVILKDGHVAAILTYLIGDDDDKYLHKRIPWTEIQDNVDGTTVYIDQLIVREHAAYKCIHKELSNVLSMIRNQFPQVKRAKWIRTDAMFRKHGIKEGVKAYVHCKDIK